MVKLVNNENLNKSSIPTLQSLIDNKESISETNNNTEIERLNDLIEGKVKNDFELSYDQLKTMFTNMKDNSDLKRKTNLKRYYEEMFDENYLRGFKVGQYSGIQTVAETQSIEPHKYIKVENAPQDLEAFVNMRGFLFKMKKVETFTFDETHTFLFEYPAFLIEDYETYADCIIEIVFNTPITEYYYADSIEPENYNYNNFTNMESQTFNIIE